MGPRIIRASSLLCALFFVQPSPGVRVESSQFVLLDHQAELVPAVFRENRFGVLVGIFLSFFRTNQAKRLGPILHQARAFFRYTTATAKLIMSGGTPPPEGRRMLHYLSTVPLRFLGPVPSFRFASELWFLIDID